MLIYTSHCEKVWAKVEMEMDAGGGVDRGGAG